LDKLLNQIYILSAYEMNKLYWSLKETK